MQVHTICFQIPIISHPKPVTYSIGNQSPQSCFTVSMSSWQRRRKFTSVSAVGGTSSVIHACKKRKHIRNDEAWILTLSFSQASAQRQQEVLSSIKLLFRTEQVFKRDEAKYGNVNSRSNSKPCCPQDKHSSLLSLTAPASPTSVRTPLPASSPVMRVKEHLAPATSKKSSGCCIK